MALLLLVLMALALYRVPSLRRPASRVLAQPAFLAAVVVLAVASLGLNAATSFLELHFKKRPVPLAVRSLGEGLPATLGAWVQVSKDEAIDPEIQQVLGTSQYVFRDYVDTRAWPAEIDQMKDLPANERELELLRLQAQKPQSVLRVAVTYYTGMADTVAHIPERCYVGDGYEVSTYETKVANCGVYDSGPRKGEPRQVSFRLIHFDDQTGSHRVSRDVAYLFHVNGEYESDSLKVRGHLQDLRERYGYYAKVELMETSPAGQGAADNNQLVATMADFLTAALPEFERCLPDWTKLHAKPVN